jgi:uncharacterized membrane protein
MLENYSTSLVSSSAATILVLSLTIPSVFLIFSRLRESEINSNTYEDRDGVATVESVSTFSTKAPKIRLVVLATIGFAASVALAVLGTLNDDGMFIENWLNAAQWVKFT